MRTILQRSLSFVKEWSAVPAVLLLWCGWYHKSGWMIWLGWCLYLPWLYPMLKLHWQRMQLRRLARRYLQEEQELFGRTPKLHVKEGRLGRLWKV